MEARPTESERPPFFPLIRALSELHDLVALADRSGRLVWVSEPLAALCGLEARAQRSLAALLGAPAPLLEQSLAQTGRLAGARVELRSHEGRRIPASVSASRLDAGSGCELSLVVFRELGAEVPAEELKRRVETLAAVLDTAPDAALVIDRGHFVTWANPALTRLTGYALEELVGRPLALLLRTRDDLERIATALREVDTPAPHEIEIRRRDGTGVSASLEAHRLTLPDGTDLGAVAWLRDVTERRRIEGELARRAEELQNWVNAVSHDLRSPLVAVLGFARLLTEDYADRIDEQGLRFLRRIEEAGRTMEALVHDLLEFARIGRSEPKRVHVDPRDVLLQLQAELKPRLEQAQLELRVPAEPPLVWCDRTQLYQVLSNLVCNAIEHAGTGSRATIDVEVFAEDAARHLVVRDWGCGVEPADRERIFELFQTRGTPSGGKRGTGIGLAIVRKIAEAHGGAAWVESHPGEGAAFHVTFPSA